MRWTRSVRLVAFVLVAVALAASGVAAAVWDQAGGAAAGAPDFQGAPPDAPPTNGATLGTIVIIKDAVPDDPQDFDFTGTLGTFKLDDDNDQTLPNTRTFTNRPPGLYTVFEQGLPGQGLPGLQEWFLGTVCTFPDGSTTQFGSQATFNLAAGATVTCTFTNTKAGRVIVDKVTVPAPDSITVFPFNAGWGNFSLKDTDQPYGNAELCHMRGQDIVQHRVAHDDSADYRAHQKHSPWNDPAQLLQADTARLSPPLS